MPLNLYMCQWLWFNRVTAQLALNKHSTMLPCSSLLFDMTLGFLTCQGGGGTDAVGVVISICKTRDKGKSSVGCLLVCLHRKSLKSKTSEVKLPGLSFWSSSYICPSNYLTHVTWKNLLTFMPLGKRFTPCLWGVIRWITHPCPTGKMQHMRTFSHVSLHQCEDFLKTGVSVTGSYSEFRSQEVIVCVFGHGNRWRR